MLLSILLAGMVAAATDGAQPTGLTAALALEERGDEPGALRELEALVAQQPTWALPRLEVARLLLAGGGDLERVEAHLDVATALEPDNPRGHYLYGQLWEERREPPLAAREYELALLYRASYLEPRLRLAAVRATQGQWAEAERHYRLLLGTRLDGVQVRLGLAQVLEARGRLKEAEREVQALRRQQPRNRLVLRRLLELSERMGLHRQAASLRAQLEPPQRKLRPLRPSRR